MEWNKKKFEKKKLALEEKERKELESMKKVKRRIYRSKSCKKNLTVVKKREFSVKKVSKERGEHLRITEAWRKKLIIGGKEV